MKHAFIFGTSIYLSNHRTISFNNGANSVVFLTIHHFYDPHNPAGGSLTIDAGVDTVDDHHQVKVVQNGVEQASDVRVLAEPNRVRLYHASHAEPLLDVYQLDPHEYHGLSSHILNEIHSQHPDPVLTIKGNFKILGAHVMIEGEKMYIDHDSFANGVENAHDGVELSSSDKVHSH